ncbi:MAG: hypothetical protein ACFB10_16920, partial [Salibacteraceae bacterium]
MLIPNRLGAPLLAALLFFLCLNGAQALTSGLAGGDIQYECLGNGQYQIELNLMRDCAATTAMPATQTVAITSSCGASFNATVSLGTPTNLECFSSLGSSSCNGGTGIGYKRYPYTGVITLLPYCNGTWEMSYTECCFQGILASTTAQSTLFLKSAIFTDVDDCNHSPNLPYSSDYPVVISNDYYSYHFGVTDQDGDRLRFQNIDWVNSLSTFQSNINSLSNSWNVMTVNTSYNPPSIANIYGYLHSFGYQQNAGVFSGPSNNSIQAYRVDQFNGAGQKIGYVTRVYPILGGFGNSWMNYSFPVFNSSGSTIIDSARIELCPGYSFAISMSFNTNDTLDTVQVFSDIQSRLPGAQLSTSGTNPVLVDVSWVAVPIAKEYTHFSISGRNQDCLLKKYASRGWEVHVKQPLDAGPDRSICQGQSTTLGGDNSVQPQWTAISGDPIVLGSNFSCATCPYPVANPSVTTVYVLTDTSAYACSSTDTVTVTVSPGLAPNGYVSGNTTLCPGDTTTLQVNGGNSYLWSTGSINASIAVHQAWAYTVTITDTTTGCSDIDTVNVTASPTPQIGLSTQATSYCAGDVAWVSASGIGSYLWSNGATTPYASFSTPGTYTVTFTDSNGCQAIDSVVASQYPNPPQLVPSPDTTLCPGDTATLTFTSLHPYQTVSWSHGPFTPYTWVTSPGAFYVTITDSFGCSAQDSIVVSPLPAPIIQVSNDTSICPHDSAILWASSSTGSIWWYLTNSDTITV